jgi:hypothetical protein
MSVAEHDSIRSLDFCDSELDEAVYDDNVELYEAVCSCEHWKGYFEYAEGYFKHAHAHEEDKDARESLWKLLGFELVERETNGSQPKIAAAVYVEHAQRGLNNTEIADALGVSEASVRRGLKKAGYRRAAPPRDRA